MTVYGNGFIAYHVEVGVTDGQAASVKAAVSAWKSELRQARTWPGFPGAMVERLRALPAVTEVACEGPQSAVLIPLRMVAGMIGIPVSMSSVLGTGPISHLVESDLECWGIRLESTKRLADADAPLEFSFREPGGHHESLRLYPASRAKYRAGIGSPAIPIDHLVLNRFNQSLRTLAEDVADRGGVVSFRPRELGRHDNIEDYISLLPFTAHLVLSTRHGVMRKLARHAGIALPRQWPGSISNMGDEASRHLVEWLFQELPETAIVVLHRYTAGDSAFYKRGHDPVVIPKPTGYDSASRAARIQGALLSTALARLEADADEDDAGGWKGWCEDVIETAFYGTELRPWIYPRAATA